MRRSRFGAVAIGLLSLTLVAAACGSSAKKTATSESSSTTAVATSSTTSASNGTTTTSGPQPQTMDQWEALWANERSAIIKRIKDNKWGKSADGKTVTGPIGFTIDLSKCPAGWNDSEGLSDTSIKIGQTLAQSGTLAASLYYGKGQDAILAYYSDKGAFKDVNGKTRKVQYIQKDDGYDPARTIPQVDELIDSEKVFAMITLGSPNTMKTYDKLNQRCVPHIFNQTGHPAWGDPVNHPWTAGLGLAYTTEAVLWGAFIDQHINEFPGGKVTVASLVVNNEFGKIYDVGFKAYLATSVNKDKINYVSETVEPQAPTITDPMTTLASKNPDVFISMTAGTFCAQSVVEAAQNGMHGKVKYMWQPNTCAGTTQLSKAKVGGDGSASEGWWIVNGGNKDILDPAQQSDPAIKWAREILTNKGIDPAADNNLGLGMIYGWAWAQTLQIAGSLDGGLNRSNLLLAARSLDVINPFQLTGMTFHADGNKDSYFTEGGIYQQWETAKQSWSNRGTVINLDGKSKNCNFDQASGVCKLY
ncbi:MAG: branched-chain amino acid transport system substrate-binding protein [Acidimicrobiia bacterium]|nr:branched-chain amino acid transport system substrate-binding protein [Acidimicrobiia bacterium]